MPNIQINYIALAIAVLANFFFGFIWFKLLFGRMWAIEMGYDPEAQPEKSKLMRSFELMICWQHIVSLGFCSQYCCLGPENMGFSGG